MIIAKRIDLDGKSYEISVDTETRKWTTRTARPQTKQVTFRENGVDRVANVNRELFHQGIIQEEV